MSIVRHIGAFSALKVGFVVCAILGLLAGVACSTIAFAGIPFGPHDRMHLTGILGLLPVVLCPLFYGILGGIVTVVGALLYNLTSAWIGGLEVDIR